MPVPVIVCLSRVLRCTRTGLGYFIILSADSLKVTHPVSTSDRTTDVPVTSLSHVTDTDR